MKQENSALLAFVKEQKIVLIKVLCVTQLDPTPGNYDILIER